MRIKLKNYALFVLNKAESWGDKLSWFALWGIVILVFFQVFFRYLLNIGLSWPDEIARYFHILIVFLSLGYVTRQDRHIRIDIFSQKINSVVNKIFTLFIVFFSSVVMVLGAIAIISRIGNLRTPAAQMPIYLFFLPVLLGFGMVLLEALRKLISINFGSERSEGEEISVE